MGGKKKRIASLLEPEARGGDIAEAGLSFQEKVTLAYLPSWLAQDGFTAMIREAIGDTEAKFFVPGLGFAVDLLEVKNHTVAPAEFWREVQRFQQLDQGAPGTYRRYTLACTGLSEVLHPLYHGLNRLRGPGNFYPSASNVSQRSWADYVELVASFGHEYQDAAFLFEKVAIHPDFSSAQTHEEALFSKALIEHFPALQDLSGRVLREIYAQLALLLRNRRNQPITRREIETCIKAMIPPEQCADPLSLHITTLADWAQPVVPTDLCFDWVDFFGGSMRTYPATEAWNSRLLKELQTTRTWIVEEQRPRRVRLRGNRRLSAALAFGWVFSAVAGFSLEMEYRGEVWATDAHATESTPPYSIATRYVDGVGDQLVVTIGILRHIASDVQQALAHFGLASAPRLELHGGSAALSPQQANIAVGMIKQEIAAVLSNAQIRHIHLFYAGPSHIALFLGHRINAFVPVQCYEYVAPATYHPTCCLL